MTQREIKPEQMTDAEMCLNGYKCFVCGDIIEDDEDCCEDYGEEE